MNFKKKIEEVKLDAEKKICEYKKQLQDLSLAYQELKAEIANRRESLLTEFQIEEHLEQN